MRTRRKLAARKAVWSSFVAVIAASAAIMGTTGGFASAAPAPTAHAAALTPVRLAVLPAFGSLPIHVAALRNMFKANGLSVAVTPLNDPAAGVAALGKQFDIALAAPNIMLAAASHGLQVKAISGMQIVDAKHPNSVLVSKTPIRSYADLKGKRVGVISLSGGSIVALKYDLQKAGVDPKTVTFSAVPLATMADQVKAGNIDVAVSAIPFFTGLSGLSVGKTDVIGDAVSTFTHGKLKSAPSAIMTVSAPWAAKNPRAVRGFQKAVAQAMAWIQKNPKQARQILQQWLKLPANVVNAAPMPGFSQPITATQLNAMIAIAKFEQALPLTGVPTARSLIVPGGDKPAL